MSSKFRNITEKGQTHEDYILDLFNNLASMPNSDFLAHIRDEQRAWELGEDKKYDEVIAKSITIYNNAVSVEIWKEKDPKDAKILVLTTGIDELIEKQEQLAALSTYRKNLPKIQSNNSRDRIQAIT